MSSLDYLKSSFNFPTRVLFGPGRIKLLARACQEAGINRPLLVTDPFLAGTDMVKGALAANESEGLPTGLFSNIQGNPVGQNLMDGIEAFRAGDHDGVIAFGGGSALDVGKVVAFMAGQSLPWQSFEDRGTNWKQADEEAIVPIIAVPTTAGTGSETGRAGVITDEADHTKKIIFHPKMMPVTVISDPELTVGMPPFITAGTGMDALAHNLEAYCSNIFHPFCDGIAVEGIRLVKEYLPRAYKDGGDIEARAQMLAAASMGSTAFQKGLGGIHALSHPIGTHYNKHHGATNALFTPYMLVHNRSAIEERIARLAAYIGLKDQSFNGFLDWTLELRSQLGMPHSLPDFEVDDSKFDVMSQMAEHDPTNETNPILCTAADYKKLYEKAYRGDLSA